MSYPASPAFNSAEFESEWAVVESTSVALNSQARWMGGQRFSFRATYREITRNEWAAIYAFIQDQQGSTETFKIRFPNLSDQRGGAGGVCRVNNVAGYPVGANLINMDGITGTLADTSFLTFAGHDKAYLATKGKTGPGQLTIQPPLVKPIVDNEIITYDGVEFLCRLPAKLRFSFPAVDHFNQTIDFVEAT